MQHCHWQDYEGAWNIDFLPYAGETGGPLYLTSMTPCCPPITAHILSGATTGNAIRAHQDLARNEESRGQGGEDEKLANVYFSYSSLEEAYAGQAAGGKPGSAKRPGSAAKRPGTAQRSAIGGGKGRDPTNIGTLRDSVAFNEQEEEEKRRQAAATPKARGLVKDTVDPRLRKGMAK